MSSDIGYTRILMAGPFEKNKEEHNALRMATNKQDVGETNHPIF